MNLSLLSLFLLRNKRWVHFYAVIIAASRAEHLFRFEMAFISPKDDEIKKRKKKLDVFNRKINIASGWN